eukprot:365075-Chlamydomonas_euryale.AAC.16
MDIANGGMFIVDCVHRFEHRPQQSTNSRQWTVCEDQVAARNSQFPYQGSGCSPRVDPCLHMVSSQKSCESGFFTEVMRKRFLHRSQAKAVSSQKSCESESGDSPHKASAAQCSGRTGATHVLAEWGQHMLHMPTP